MAFKDTSKSSVVFPQEKKQKILLAVLGLVVVICLIVLYFGFWRESSNLPSEMPVAPGAEDPLIDSGTGAVTSSEDYLPGSSSESSLGKIKESISFDTGFLRDPVFQELKTYGQWPLKIEKKGRDDPFRAY